MPGGRSKTPLLTEGVSQYESVSISRWRCSFGGCWSIFVSASIAAEEEAQDAPEAATTADAEIAVQRQNREIEKAQEIQGKAGEANEELEDVQEKPEEAKASGGANPQPYELDENKEGSPEG